MKLLKLFLLFCVGFISCTEPQRPIVVEQPVIAQQTEMVQTQPEYTTYQNPHTSQQMVMFRDKSGLEQMMEYAMFMSLMDNVGRGNCWDCIYNRRDYYQPRNQINVYRQYNVVSDRSYRYNQSGQNYNNRTNNVTNKSGTATTAYGNGIENKTLTRQPNTNVGQTAQPITQQSGIQNKTLTRQPIVSMPPPIVKTPTQTVQKPTFVTKTASPIKQVTLTRKPK